MSGSQVTPQRIPGLREVTAQIFRTTDPSSARPNSPVVQLSLGQHISFTRVESGQVPGKGLLRERTVQSCFGGQGVGSDHASLPPPPAPWTSKVPGEDIR